MRKSIGLVWILIVLTAVFFDIQGVFASQESTNVALSVNNPKASVSSVSHPEGSKAGNVRTYLNGAIDGLNAATENLLYLAFRAQKDSVYDEVLAPLGVDEVTGKPKTMDICLDLGDVYDINKIVLRGRPAAAGTGNNNIDTSYMRVYVSNDPGCAAGKYNLDNMVCVKDFGKSGSIVQGEDSKYIIEFADTLSGDADAVFSGDSSYRYVIVVKDWNMGNQYAQALVLGDLEVYSQGVDEALNNKLNFYNDLNTVTEDTFVEVIQRGIEQNVISSSIVEGFHLDALAPYFAGVNAARASGLLETSIESIFDENTFLEILKIADFLLGVDHSQSSSELKEICEKYRSNIKDMIGESTDLDVFVEIYQPLIENTVEALIKNIKFYDAMCGIKDKDAETIAKTLETRYEDLGIDLEHIQKYTTIEEVAKRIDNTIPQDYYTNFGGEVEAIVQEIIKEAEEKIKKDIQFNRDKSGIYLSIFMTPEFIKNKIEIGVVFDTAELKTESIEANTMAEGEIVNFEYLFAQNNNTQGEYSVYITMTDEKNADIQISMSAWCIEEQLENQCFEALNQATSNNVMTAIDNCMMNHLILEEDKNFLTAYIDETAAAEKYFLLARSALADGVFNANKTELSSTLSFQNCVNLACFFYSLETEEASKIIESYEKCRKYIESFLTPTFDINKFAAVYRSDEAVTSNSEALAERICYYDALSQLYKATYAEIEMVLNNYASVLGIDIKNDIINKNVKVIDVAKKINTNIPDSYHTQFDKEVDIIVQSLVNSQNQSGTQSSSGSGYRGGGGSSFGISKPAVDGSETEENGLHEENEQTATPSVFSDLDSVAWAQEAIENLYRKNVINGVGDGRFEPNAPVSREEMVKMLVVAFELSSTGGSYYDFLDIKEDDWFYSYVQAGYQNGIVNGISETMFGVGENISRQDLAVMCYRIIQRSGVEIKKETTLPSFTDSKDFAEYAWDAINILGQNEILMGFEDGSFRPNATATRAEASVIINRLLSLKMEDKI